MPCYICPWKVFSIEKDSIKWMLYFFLILFFMIYSDDCYVICLLVWSSLYLSMSQHNGKYTAGSFNAKSFKLTMRFFSVNWLSSSTTEEEMMRDESFILIWLGDCVSGACIYVSVLFTPYNVFIWGRSIELDDASVAMLMNCASRWWWANMC